MNEIWKPVLGWETILEVSNLGNVRRIANRTGSKLTKLDTPKPLKPYKSKQGYLMVAFSYLSFIYRKFVHVLVKESFDGPRPPGMDCCHLDGNPGNPNLNNLMWATRKVNISHKKLHGTHLAGERSPNAKLTDAQALDIRKMHAEGLSMKDIAAKLNIGRGKVYCIVVGKLWAHLPGAIPVKRPSPRLPINLRAVAKELGVGYRRAHQLYHQGRLEKYTTKSANDGES